ncbi:telomeric repeat binding factor a [Tautogolabrus adspersus]
MDMAAKETVKTPQSEVESIINRWLVDYYYCCLLEVFKKDLYDDFCGIRGVVESVLARPVQSTDVMPTKLRVLHFLSRINEGEKLDLIFEADQSITPLESALTILESMGSENLISQQDFQKVSTSLKEMIVGILIKNEEFDKAKEVLNKHFPKKMVGKKAIFTGLIRQKSKTHEVIEKINFQQFKQEMLAFCERLCPISVPFLHQAAKRLIDERKQKEDDKAAEAVEQEEPGPSSHLPVNVNQFLPCKPSIILRTRLEGAYIALSTDSDMRTFAQLEAEVEREEQNKRESHSLHCSLAREKSTNQDILLIFQRDSGSPLEASPADQTPQTDAVLQTQAGSLSKTPEVKRTRRSPYNVARLVVEPDSQGSSQSTPALQDQLADLRTEELPRSAAKANEENWNRASTSLAEFPQKKDEGPSHSKWKKLYNNAKESRDTWSDEETYFNSQKNSKPQDESTVSNTGQKRKLSNRYFFVCLFQKWTEDETEKLKEGVKRFGEGNWSNIKDYFSFKGRTNVQLKDRWRTMKKSKLV